jgi:2-oxo-4-hydroxy-4-carboxy-5-ureidoimidazoline decarboxylase
MTGATTIAALNAADRTTFAALLAGIYEHSPWVAERTWDARPFADRNALAEALDRVVATAADDEQLDLIRRHPRLGARAPMARHSEAEQGGAGLRAMADEERARLLELNEQYERRFGFPFILAVKGLTVRDIIAKCRARLANEVAAEHEEALRQIRRIAAFRLTDTVAAGPDGD